MIKMREWVADMPHYNPTTFKSVWVVRLWIGTAVTTLLGNLLILVIAAYLNDHSKPFVVPDMVARLYEAWLFALAAFSGITTSEFYGKRTTDVDYTAAKNQAPQTQVVTTGDKTTVVGGAAPAVNGTPVAATVTPPAPAPTSPGVGKAIEDDDD